MIRHGHDRGEPLLCACSISYNSVSSRKRPAWRVTGISLWTLLLFVYIWWRRKNKTQVVCDLVIWRSRVRSSVPFTSFLLLHCFHTKVTCHPNSSTYVTCLPLISRLTLYNDGPVDHRSTTDRQPSADRIQIWKKYDDELPSHKQLLNRTALGDVVTKHLTESTLARLNQPVERFTEFCEDIGLGPDHGLSYFVRRASTPSTPVSLTSHHQTL